MTLLKPKANHTPPPPPGDGNLAVLRTFCRKVDGRILSSCAKESGGKEKTLRTSTLGTPQRCGLSLRSVEEGGAKLGAGVCPVRTQGERNEKAAAPPSSRDTRQPSHNCLHSVPHSGQSCAPEPGSPLLPEQVVPLPRKPCSRCCRCLLHGQAQGIVRISYWLGPSIPLPTAVTQSGSESCEESHRKFETEVETLCLTSSALNGRWAGVRRGRTLSL